MTSSQAFLTDLDMPVELQEMILSSTAHELAHMIAIASRAGLERESLIVSQVLAFRTQDYFRDSDYTEADVQAMILTDADLILNMLDGLAV